jgi:hypothetical protein
MVQGYEALIERCQAAMGEAMVSGLKFASVVRRHLEVEHFRESLRLALVCWSRQFACLKPFRTSREFGPRDELEIPRL